MDDTSTLKRFLTASAQHAARYGRDLYPVVRELFGAILWVKDRGPITTMKEMKNAVWVKIDGKTYALAYDADQQQIDLREKTTLGRIVHSFDSRTPPGGVFGALLRK